MVIVTPGIDLAKNIFALHGVDAAGKVALQRPSVKRAKLLEDLPGHCNTVVADAITDLERLDVRIGEYAPKEAEPENQDLRRHLGQRGQDADLDGIDLDAALAVSATVLPFRLELVQPRRAAANGTFQALLFEAQSG